MRWVISFQPIDALIRLGRPPNDLVGCGRISGAGGPSRLTKEAGAATGDVDPAIPDGTSWTADSLALWIGSLAPWTSWLTFTVDDDKAARLQNSLWTDAERDLFKRSNKSPEAVMFRAAHPVTLNEDWLGGQFRWWVAAYNRWANNGMLGYKRRWGHSLFSYACAFDYGDRSGRLHAHALTTFIDWPAAAQLWRDRIGSFDFEPVGDVIGRAKYLAGYMVRRGRSLDFLWLQRRDWSLSVGTFAQPGGSHG